MRFRKCFNTAALVVGLSLISAQTRAVDLLSNLPSNDGNITTISATSNVRTKAAAFTMPGTAYTLDSVVLRLSNFDAADTPVVEIRNDGGTNPGSTVLANFTNPAGQGAAFLDYTFTPTSAFTLSSSTKYWLVVSSSNGHYDWSANIPNQAPTGLATYNGVMFSNNFGASWTNSTIINSFKITGTVVPEPSTVILSGLAVTAIAANSYFRRRKAGSPTKASA